MRTHREAARDTDLVESAEVIVCGAGPAGVAAALAAARSGARTRLIEVQGCLGGVWTAGLLSWIIDVRDKPGIMVELTAELERRGARATREHTTNYAYDVEAMKLLLEELCLAAGVQVRLHTRVVAAARDAANRLAVVVTESKSGREAWTAKAFVDATGDGDLAALAGCGFELGRPDSGQCQPLSLICLLTGLRYEAIREFVGGSSGQAKDNLLAELRRGGAEPSYGAPTIFRIRDDLFAMMANHEYGVSALDAEAIGLATLRARAEVHHLVAALRSLGEPWSAARVVATAEQIGVREGRRIHGLYTVGVDDLVAGATHEDAVCRCHFGIDVHATDPGRSKSYDRDGRPPTKPYDIPLRALIARDVDGLLMAGRCISGDFLAHSSYRVTGDAVAMGQAAGVCAALAARHDCPPREVPWSEVKAGLSALQPAPAE